VPAFEWVPEYSRTYGDIAAEVGEQVGLPPDPDQRAILDAIYAVHPDDRPVCFEVGVLAPRQNIKTSTLEVAALTDLFVFREPLHIWTAHLFKTARKSFDDMVMRIEGNRDFRRRCRKPRTANGDESIELLTGEKIEFHARSKGGGRGLTGNKVTLDEALFLVETDMGAVLPTLATIPSAQVRYGSSAGMLESNVLRGVRNRGRAGHDPTLAYFEWAAAPTKCKTKNCPHLPVGEIVGCALDNRRLWKAANPALGRRISVEAMAKFRRAMPPKEFAREFLGWWEDLSGVASPIDVAAWGRLTDPKSQLVDPVAFAVDSTPDRAWSSIAVAGARADGLEHVEIVAHGAGLSWVVKRLGELGKTWKPCAVVVDPGSAAGSLLPDLAAAGIAVVTPTVREYAQACGALQDSVTESLIRHLGDALLHDALTGARSRPVGDAWIWSRKDSSVVIAPLVAVTLARWGWSVKRNESKDLEPLFAMT
jgi:hypothetical protein